VAMLSPSDNLPLDQPRRALLERLGTSYRALIAVPLATEEVYGAITLYYHAPRSFSEEDVGLAVAFSDHAALAIRNAQLRAQVEQAAVASERRRLAHDLHDSVTQVLFSASLTAEVLPVIWRRDQAEGERALEDLRELTRGALAEMRMLLLELRPAALQEARLDDLLAQLAAAFTGRARVPVALDVQAGCELPAEVRVAFFRIAQEALNNVAKHAEASQVSLSLRCRLVEMAAGQHPALEATLSICDDGRGFDPAETPLDHLGLDIMRERAAAIGAVLAIDSRPAQGVDVSAIWRDIRSDQG
jgi:signal transduction histidine kinase